MFTVRVGTGGTNPTTTTKIFIYQKKKRRGENSRAATEPGRRGIERRSGKRQEQMGRWERQAGRPCS